MASTTIDTKINPLEWALRVVESIAFSIHGILGMMEPFTGCVQSSFQDKCGAMPAWFWPVAGILLWTVAIANFSKNGKVVLGAQAYIAAFHMGGVFYHLRLGHHLLVGCAPGIFLVFAFIITAIRTNSVLVAFGGLLACTVVAFLLSRILVTPPPTTDDENQQGAMLLGMGENNDTSS